MLKRLMFPCISFIFFSANANAEEEWVACGWCESTGDFESHVESLIAPRPTGYYDFKVGNPNSGILMNVAGYVEQQPEPAPPRNSCSSN